MAPSLRTPAAPPAPAEPTLEQSRRDPWRLVSRVAIVALIVGLASMWAYAFLGSYGVVKVDVAGKLPDTTFPTAAEPVCKQARADMADLPRAFENTDHTFRAGVVDRSTAILERMVDDLRTTIPAAEPGRRVVTEWLDDWSLYNRNRRSYAESLRKDPMTRFQVAQSDRDKRQITLALDNFAAVNTMASCKTPGDLI